MWDVQRETVNEDLFELGAKAVKLIFKCKLFNSSPNHTNDVMIPNGVDIEVEMVRMRREEIHQFLVYGDAKTMVLHFAFMDGSAFEFSMQWREQPECLAEISRLGRIEEIVTISLTDGRAVFGVNHNMIMCKEIEAKDDISMETRDNNSRHDMKKP